MLDLAFDLQETSRARLPDHHDRRAGRAGGEAARRHAERAGLSVLAAAWDDGVRRRGRAVPPAARRLRGGVGGLYLAPLRAGRCPTARCRSPAFRRYLVQDYLFLIHFARAKALAVFKAESLEAMRDKAAAIAAILRRDAAAPRATAPNGASSEAAVRADAGSGRDGELHPLRDRPRPRRRHPRPRSGARALHGGLWRGGAAHPGRPARARRRATPTRAGSIPMPAEDYQALARGRRGADRRARARAMAATARFALLAADFAEAARLEARFWQQGLDARRGMRDPRRHVRRRGQQRRRRPAAGAGARGGRRHAAALRPRRRDGSRRAPAAPGRTSTTRAASPTARHPALRAGPRGALPRRGDRGLRRQPTPRGETPIPCIRCNQTVKFQRPGGAGPRPRLRGAGHRPLRPPRRGAGRRRSCTAPPTPRATRATSCSPPRRTQLAFSPLPARRLAGQGGGAGRGGAARPARSRRSRTARTSASSPPAATTRWWRASARMRRSRARSCTSTAGCSAGTRASRATRWGRGAASAWRRGTGEQPLYVAALDAARRRVVVGAARGAAAGRGRGRRGELAVPAARRRRFACEVKLRAREAPQPATAAWDADAGLLRVRPAAPAIAAPGQACVLYDGDRVLGGGFIRAAAARRGAAAIDTAGTAA